MHRDTVIAGNIEAHALQQLTIVPATAEQRSNGRQRENPERTTEGSPTRRQASSLGQQRQDKIREGGDNRTVRS
ncbi:hypothetical protein D3C87_1862280 [compost metagenome]